ncbi:hypothetical protein AVEN_197747-1 [Araneus ventricosus]|uniref:G-protein coupled receptors family 1 profile domain-containing protein n=1 Tax=Araneus ventricosus TaxID=182803 RepID=A0A4Y2CMN5_ARAVE|nr:hypothetical protein AVEN_197747-1 [Araneus ventricosus]
MLTYQDLQSAIFFFCSSTAILNPLIYGAFHLRTEKNALSKSTSFYNSNYSRTENTFMNSFHRSHGRKSTDEYIGLQTNGSLTIPSTSHKGERKSIVADFKSSLSSSQKSVVSSF